MRITVRTIGSVLMSAVVGMIAATVWPVPWGWVAAAVFGLGAGLMTSRN